MRRTFILHVQSYHFLSFLSKLILVHQNTGPAKVHPTNPVSWFGGRYQCVWRASLCFHITTCVTPSTHPWPGFADLLAIIHFHIALPLFPTSRCHTCLHNVKYQLLFHWRARHQISRGRTSA